MFYRQSLIMKYFLLARPSALIVEKMKKLVESVGATPIPLKNLFAVNTYKPEDVEAIVVSTALSSPVEETFTQVIQHCWKSLGKKPTFLASYADLRRTKVIACAKFKECGMDVELVGLSEVINLEEENLHNPIFIITHDEIANPESFSTSLMAVKRILQRYHAIAY